MKSGQQEPWQIVLLLLAVVGAGIAVYLTSVHYENVPLICSNNGVVDCARVLSSSYSVIPGTQVPITIPGLGWCIVSGALAVFAWRPMFGQQWLRLAQFLWSLVGLLTALYLVYVEIVRIHAICAWCTALHVVILVMFLITLVQQRQPEMEEVEDELS